MARVWGKYVTWGGFEGVYLYDIETNTTLQVADVQYRAELVINDEYLAWLDGKRVCYLDLAELE